MSNIHFFLGAKGGVGKTLLALSSLLAYQEMGETCLLIDMNFNNADLMYTLLPLTNAEEHIMVGKGYGLFPIHAQGIKNAFLVSPLVGESKYGKLPYRGIYQIFRDIDDILADVNKAEVQTALRITGVDQVLVDTGMHLSNMKTSAEGREFDDWNEINLIKAFQPRVWFIWTFAMADRAPEAAATRESVLWLERISNGGSGQWFDQKRHLIHVVNPPAFFASTRSAWSRFQFSQDAFNPLLKLATAPRLPNGIDFIKLYQKMAELNAQVNIEELPLDEFCKSFVEMVALTVLEGRQQIGKQYRNIFINPYYLNKLEGYLNHLEATKAIDIKKLQSTLAEVKLVVRTFLPELQ